MDILFTANCYLASKRIAEHFVKAHVQLAPEDLDISRIVADKAYRSDSTAVHIARLPKRGELHVTRIPHRSDGFRKDLRVLGV